MGILGDFVFGGPCMHIFIQREKNMKKILALAAVAVTAVALASADPLFVGHAYFGVGLGSAVQDWNKGNSTRTDLGNNYKWNFGSNLDFGAGVAINIPFGDYFGFQPGVDFYVNNVGYHYETGNGYDKRDQTFTYLSLDIPLLFTAKINKWNFAIGPYVSIPLGDVTSTRNIISSSSLTSYKYSHSWGSIGALVGVGYEMRIGLGRLVFGGRYFHDFMPIDVEYKDYSNSWPDGTLSLWRGALEIDVAYKIPLSF